jgi:hypothetical protein
MNINTTPEAKVFLQNKLARSRNRLAEVGPLVESKKREVQSLEGLREAYASNPALGNPDEVMDSLFESERCLAVMEDEMATLKTETDVLVSVLGDDQGNRLPHSFKPTSFTIPTNCAVCETNVWGLGKQGLTCRSCGMNIHAKCELKVGCGLLSERNLPGGSLLIGVATLGSCKL